MTTGRPGLAGPGEERWGEPQCSYQAGEMLDLRTLGFTFALDDRNHYKHSLNPHTALSLFLVIIVLQSHAWEIERLLSGPVGPSFCLGSSNGYILIEHIKGMGRKLCDSTALEFWGASYRSPARSRDLLGLGFCSSVSPHRSQWGIAAGSL